MFPLSEEHRQLLLEYAIDWAISHGFLMRSGQALVHAPFTLLPSRIPRTLFEQATILQPIMSTIVHALSKDSEFLHQAIKPLCVVDDFTGRLYGIYCRTEKTKQNLTIGVLRSDYMLHDNCLAQVEINTISSSMGALSSLASKLHRQLKKYSGAYCIAAGDPTDDTLPYFDTCETIAEGIAFAHKEYIAGGGHPDAIVLVVVQPSERNIVDQRTIEFKLLENYKILCFRKTLYEIDRDASIMDGKLCLGLGAGWREISVVYFRAGYTPNDYPSQCEWRGRLKVEESLAIKCPNIAQQLVGTKKVQQLFSSNENLLRKILNNDDVAAVRRTFVGIYALDGSPEGNAALSRAMKNPESFVLKPQREGGGNNIYGHDILRVLKSLSPTEKLAYTLMEKIKAPISSNLLVRHNELTETNTIFELGTFGVYIARDDAIIFNKYAGHLLRTKDATSNEGGVAAGHSVFDCPMLV